MRQNFEPIQRYFPFDFGTAFHAGMEAYYWPSAWNYKSLREFNAMHAFKSTYTELAAKVKVGALDFELSFDEAVALGMGMLKYYFRWAPKYDNFVPIFVEIEFEVPIPTMPGWVYQGRIDLVVQDENGYWIVDHKTAKTFGDTAWLWLDDQCASYAWALQKMLGLKIQGVIYNQVKKAPPHPPRQLKNGGFSVAKNQDTSFEMYLATLREHGIDPRHYREFLSYLKHNPKEYVKRTHVRYTPQQLEIVEKRIIQEAREMGNPEVQIYPTPSPMNCNGCRFLGPCLQIQAGGQPSFENYQRRS